MNLLNGEANFLCEWKYWKTFIENSEADEGLIKQKINKSAKLTASWNLYRHSSWDNAFNDIRSTYSNLMFIYSVPIGKVVA